MFRSSLKKNLLKENLRFTDKLFLFALVQITTRLAILNTAPQAAVVSIRQNVCFATSLRDENYHVYSRQHWEC